MVVFTFTIHVYENRMHQDFNQWLSAQAQSDGSQSSRIANVKKIEQSYGELDGHFANGTYQEIIDSLEYSADDKRANKPNPSKIPLGENADIYNNLQMYKAAARLYRKFLNDAGFKDSVPIESESAILSEALAGSEDNQQRLSLERDMQEALRNNITSLDASLRIIDGNKERLVDSGRIDITCEDGKSIVVIELKAGKADSRAIGQILGYMGDLQEEESGKPVRGILVAHDFDRRAKAAARVVPTLTLMRYSIEFKFMAED